MRSLDRPFEQINSEQLVKRVYNWASPIDGTEPTDSIVVLGDGQSRTFRVETPVPLSHALEIVWRIDGQPVASGSNFTLNSADVSPGSHTIDVTVSDPTSLVRNDPAKVLRESRGWDVSVIVSVRAPDLAETEVSNPPASAAVGTGSYFARGGRKARWAAPWPRLTLIRAQTGRQMAGGERGADTHAPRLIGGTRRSPGTVRTPGRSVGGWRAEWVRTPPLRLRRHSFRTQSPPAAGRCW